MSAIADWLARRVWGAMLWFIRRPLVRRLQRWSVEVWPAPAQRERARASLIRQERLARRIGLSVLRGVFTACLYALGLLAVYNLGIAALSSGCFALPDRQVSPRIP